MYECVRVHVCMCVCMYKVGHTRDMVCMWRSEDNFEDAILAFHLLEVGSSVVAGAVLCASGHLDLKLPSHSPAWASSLM